MSLSDLTTEGSFVWHYSGKSANLTDWYENEPDDFFQREDCVDMFKSKDGYAWRDDDCTRSYNYICETNATAVPETTLEPTTQEPNTTMFIVPESTTGVTTVTSGCKQLYDITWMAIVLAVVFHYVI
ncbi:alpha-N-acetylgalactosamine-specific lectin-like [Mercenaria mercenaria]|uniref:alpha-N-acetylgalactosamine-specific lectin-like n=1 Tax=Mercenaria mercenaria TaxID=6596 RepID=UPI00234FB49D|nr:alpha-N-acetylgalactosamine-specific lectin-like [Mercenaria mercenaria]